MRSGIYIMLGIFMLTLFVMESDVYSDEPDEWPFLRIETGMHTAVISRIALDPNGRYLITASYDKTIRVWELSTGKLIRTIRPPIGWGDEGKIYAIAVSPDGKTIACGGWTGYEWEESNSIYLFKLKNGKLIKRIKGLPSVIFNLKYSSDGRFLAATIGRSNGIRIFSTSDWKLTLSEDYGDDTYGADFDINGRFITASYDGFIRLYDKDFNLITKTKSRSGNQPFTVRFSPDGGKIAVGFDDSTTVDVLLGKDLSYLYSPDTGGVDTGDLSKVAWSSDGRSLYAGGRYAKDNVNYIRKWADEGKGGYIDLPASNDTIMHILPLKDGGIVFGAADPSFGVFSPDDKRTLYMPSPIIDFRANFDGFLISEDGFRVGFGYEYGGKTPSRFTVSNYVLEIGHSEDKSLLPPITKAEGMDISDWKYANPRLNGQWLMLKEHEISRSLAIAPDGGAFLIGTDWYLRLFDKEGNELWAIPTPAPAWGVNISGNGKVAVASFGDGTIRWYRMDGEELLTLFLFNDKENWVIWTPSGYYNASPEIGKSIGWHKNKGIDKASEFLPESKLKDTYFRPDVIAKMLETFDEAEAISLAEQALEQKEQKEQKKEQKKDSKWKTIKRGKTVIYYYDPTNEGTKDKIR